MNEILVLDVGTSSAKAVLFDRRGRVQAEAESRYDTHVSVDGKQEQNPRDWWAACASATRALGDLGSTEAVAMTGTMQSVIPLDADGEPLRPAILYGDSRAGGVFRQLARRFESLNADDVVGNHLNALMSVFKMVWLREHEPEIYAATATFHSGAKDYIIHRLAGVHVTDPTAATTVGLMDIRRREWADGLADAADIPLERLPRIAPSDAVVGRTAAAAARGLGIREGLPIINGCGDAGAATLGAGVSKADQSYAYLGTSAWIATVQDVASLRLPHELYTLAHPSRNLAIRVGAMLSGGDSVAWCRELLGHDFRRLQDELSTVDTAPPDLMFLPYLRGERCPFLDAQVRGGFLGLDRSFGPAHLLYAVLEGVAFALRANLEALGARARELRLIGGGAASAVWPQLIADICGRSIVVNEIPTAATAYGAFRIAAERLDLDVDEARWTRVVHPRSSRTPRNEERRQAFNEATQFAREFARRRSNQSGPGA